MHSPDGCLSVLVCVYRQTSPSCKQNILQTAEQASQNQLTFTQAPVDASCRNASSFEVKLPRLKAEKKDHFGLIYEFCSGKTLNKTRLALPKRSAQVQLHPRDVAAHSRAATLTPTGAAAPTAQPPDPHASGELQSMAAAVRGRSAASRRAKPPLHRFPSKLIPPVEIGVKLEIKSPELCCMTCNCLRFHTCCLTLALFCKTKREREAKPALISVGQSDYKQITISKRLQRSNLTKPVI